MNNSPDSFLDTPLDMVESDSSLVDKAGAVNLIPITLLEGELDPRLKLLSHSSRTLLHTCPRKYQLYRLSSKEISIHPEKQTEQDVTFAYGHAVGKGIQSVLEGKTEDQVILDTFLSWNTDLLEENKRQKKSFWLALFAVQRFIAMRETGFLEDYELVYYTNKAGKLVPATELAFQIILPNGFIYRGFVDAVLRHKITKEIMVLECKTSSSQANAASFKNSGQALGYSVVLDILFPDLSAYTVLYLVYETKTLEYKELIFEKSLLQRALWLQELLIDTEVVELYNSYKVYPLHGESCFDFYRDCEYLGLCTLHTENLTKPLTQDVLDFIEEDSKKYEFVIHFSDLIEAQIKKGES